ncbi:MAG: hypothetical protein ABIE03_06930 [Patescibacteria group bacterium]|nr:cell division protein FtsL [Patescibacteria group bacterium]
MREFKGIQIAYRPSLLIVLGIILVVAMFSQLAFLSFFGTKGKEVASIRSEQKRLILENEMLEAEISNQQSLSRIKEVAVEEMGMIEADDIKIISPRSVLGENQ